MSRTHRALFFFCHLAIAVSVAAAWGMMLFRAGNNGLLSTAGLGSLRYFTVLSNLMAGAASLCCAVTALRGRAPGWTAAFQFASAAAVLLTFMTVVVFLGPLLGYAAMYRGANLWFHLIVPLLSVFAFCLLQDTPVRFFHTVTAVVPMLVYGVGYVLNILINGIGERGNTNDWYGFLQWGWGPGVLIFCGMILLTWGMAAALRTAQQLRLKKAVDK